LSQKQKLTNQLYLNNNNIFCETAQLNFSKVDKQQFTLFSPRIIGCFTTNQMKKPKKLKNKSFNASIYIGVLRLVKTLLMNFHNNIIGIKIIGSGK